MNDTRVRSVMLLLLLAGLVLVLPAAAAPTTSLTVRKLADDGVTVLEQTTVDYLWMEANLPVYGDGVTHYYHQGPTFDPADLWDPGETVNVDSRDYGTPKGSGVKDLCDLVGGMNDGEWVKIKAPDGFNKIFDYDDVYQPEPELGTLVIAWYNPTYGGYVPTYDTGMRLIIFAGPEPGMTKHVFGNWDMHEYLAENRWHYFYDGTDFWPSSSGLSVQTVGEIIIYSDDPVPPALNADFSASPTSGPAPLTVQFTDLSAGSPDGWAWDLDADGDTDSTAQSPSYVYQDPGVYNVALTVTKGTESDTETKAEWISVAFPPAPQDWTIQLVGKMTEEVSRTTYESWAAANPLSYTDTAGTWSGTALWRLLARVDDSDPLTFNDAQADLGYNVVITAGDGFTRTVPAATLKRNDVWIVADRRDGNPLPFSEGGKPVWPLKIVGTGLTSGQKVGNITRIELKDFVSPPEIPVAAFDASPLTGVAPLTVQFTDQSTGTAPLTHEWDFGDGGTSTESSPSYIYQVAGTYTVKLTVTNSAGSDVEEKAALITVTEAPVAPVAEFTASPLTGTAPLSVQFTDQSTGTPPLTYAWDFGDTGTSADPSPSHVFAMAGTYTVTLTVSNDAGTNVKEKAAYITVSAAPPTIDVLFDGPVTLTPDATITQLAYNSGASYTVEEDTPLGALHATGLSYGVTDKNFGTSGALLLDDVEQYLRKKPGYWYAYVNDVYKDGYNNPAGALNLIALADGDRAEFYYAAGITDPADLDAVKAAATAAVKTVASTGVTPPTDWTLVLAGAQTESVSKAFFESGLACPQSGHQVFWTDGDQNVWGGVPLWVLAGMVDDDPDEGPLHFNFNDALAAQHYQVKVIGSDGWSAIFDSAAIARSGDYVVANTLNGEPLPALTDSGKPSWPLFLKGASVLGGQQVGGIARIELLNMPEPVEGWTLAMLGEVGDTITQEEFENGLACEQSGHLVEWNDKDGNVWSGVPLWVLAGTVDDIELADHWTFNDDLATMAYTVQVTASDGFSRTFSSEVVARNNNYLVANRKNGQPLDDTAFPLRLVGSGVTRTDGSLSGSAVGKIARIDLLELQTLPASPGSYNLSVKGKITDMLSQAEIEQGMACPDSGHYAEWTQVIKNADGSVKETHTWSGFPLWFLAGWVDDRQPHEFNAVQATAGYKITVKAIDGYAKDFTSTDIAWSDDYIVATKKDGVPLTTSWPLQLVGAPLVKDDGSLGGKSVGKIAEIELTEFGTPVEAPTLHIVKYAEDRTTIVAEATVDYNEMMAQFDTIGDGTTLYRYEGVTMDPEDIWGEFDETKGGFKVSNAVKGTRLLDLVSLVGGMGDGTDLVLVASDGYRTILPYTSVHTTPDIQARQGDAVLAWYADGKYVPGYTDGMRLFFMPDDHLYGQWDMHETLPPGYWHYFYQTYDPQDPEYGEYAPGILYPSAAGLSAKYVTEVRVYTTPETQWNLQLDGTSLGGMRYSVAKSYFEQALACQMGANHQMSYTDTSGNVWSGMPLWFLAGFVDDADQHSNNAFNDALAAAGYRVVVTADDGYSATLDSRLIGRNSNYLVANTLNGAAIPETDSSWPLRLVGTNVTGKTGVKGIAQIQLLPLVAKPVTSFTAAPLIGDAPLEVQFTDTSTGEITAWAWDFGDGETSTDPSPDHTFTAIGVYSISLTVTGPGGSDTRTETEYITALRPIPDDLGAEEDTFIDSSYLTTNVYGRRIPVRDINYGSSTGLAVVRGSRDMAGYSNWRASLIRFDLEGLAGRTESGTLHLNRTTINSDWISIYRMNVPWEEMEATFNVPSDGAASWAGDWYPGGNYAAEPSDTVYVRGDEAWVEFDVSADMDAFAAGTPNYGWILRAADGSSSWSTVSFASGEAKEGYRPYMTFD